MGPLILWLAAVSLVAFALVVVDKRAARRSRFRVPERVLLGVAFSGGTPGIVVGMVVAGHKTRKLRFLVALGGVVAVQGVVLFFVLRGAG